MVINILIQTRYKGIDQFATDVRLVFQNCKTLNPDYLEVRRAVSDKGKQSNCKIMIFNNFVYVTLYIFFRTAFVQIILFTYR